MLFPRSLPALALPAALLLLAGCVITPSPSEEPPAPAAHPQDDDLDKGLGVDPNGSPSAATATPDNGSCIDPDGVRAPCATAPTEVDRGAGLDPNG